MQIATKRTKINLAYSTLFSNGTLIAGILFLIIFSVYVWATNNSLSLFSINNLLNNTATLAIASVGLTLVILSGGFDLSVGGSIILANVMIASQGAVSTGDLGINLVMVFAIVLCVGVINGFFIAYIGVQPIATTLATMIICQGIALIIMPSPGGRVSPLISSGLTSTFFGFLPIVVIILILIIILWTIIKNTTFGVHVYAIGEDERAATQAGINVRKVKFLVYVVASFFYGLAGVMFTAQTSSGDPRGSTLFLLLVFAAVAIGGTQFGGGRGGAIGSIIGAGILTLLQVTLFALGISSFYTSIFQGVVLIAAIVLGSLSSRLVRRGETI